MSWMFEKIDTCEDMELVEKARSHCEDASSDEALIFNWVNSTQSVEIASGYDDEKDEDGVCVVFRSARKEIGHAWKTVAKLREHYPDIVTVDQAVITSESQSGIDNDEWFEARKRRHQMSWCDALQTDLVDRCTAIELSLSYAMVDTGTASISDISLDEDFLDTLSMENDGRIKDKQVLFLGLMYHENYSQAKREGKGIINGWGENFHIV